MISKELLSEVLGLKVLGIYTENEEEDTFLRENEISYTYMIGMQGMGGIEREIAINIHELAFKNLKQWAKLKNVFDIINWAGEPEEIFAKAEELRNEIN